MWLKLLAALTKFKDLAPEIMQLIELLSQMLTKVNGGKPVAMSGELTAEAKKVKTKLVEAGLPEDQAARGAEIASALDDRT
jgi:hypothetical protein